uniref:Uncharacterized protein n=1 Tax=Anguilla anguilla TaxID=7936 RepID=A0A0E9PPA8_ANGAN
MLCALFAARASLSSALSAVRCECSP